MIYLNTFTLPEQDVEEKFLNDLKLTCYNNYYPFGIFPNKKIARLYFEPITVLYGGNGSGKTTLLNIIAEKLSSVRNALYNKSAFFGDYVGMCEAGWEYQDSKIITSDDVFDYIFDIREINQGIDEKRNEILREYSDLKYAKFQMKSLDDYAILKKNNEAKRKTKSDYTRNKIMKNLPTKSNGESAYLYFTHEIEYNGIYLLDEPENSLSAEFQMNLSKFIEESARFYNCQFIIATHSPFLLSLKQAKIYDLDEIPVITKKWSELKNVRAYYDLFRKNQGDFD